MNLITTVEQAKTAGEYDAKNGAGAYKNAATVPEPASSTSSGQPLIVTSGSSRSQYSNNVTGLNNAISNITTPKYGDEIIDTAGNKGIAKFDSKTGKPLTPEGKNAEDPSKNPDSADNVLGNDTTRNAIDPSLRSVYDTSLKNLDEGIANAKNSLQSALSTLNNDPAANAAVNMIMAKYDEQIQAMKAKNRILLGSEVKNSARSGGLQYANEMDTNFMSEEQDKASKRVTDLITLETQMVLKAQAEYKKGNVAAFDSASKALEKATKDKTDAIDNLLKETDTIVKEKQADVKLKAAEEKQQVTDNIRISNSLGNVIAQNLISGGIKDPKKRRQYIEMMAEESGITNPDMLESAVVKAESSINRTNLLNQSTQKSINKKSTTGPDGKVKPYANFKSKPTGATISKVNAYIQSIGGNQAAIDAANADEVTFYKVLNAIPK